MHCTFFWMFLVKSFQYWKASTMWEKQAFQRRMSFMLQMHALLIAWFFLYFILWINSSMNQMDREQGEERTGRSLRKNSTSSVCNKTIAKKPDNIYFSILLTYVTKYFYFFLTNKFSFSARPFIRQFYLYRFTLIRIELIFLERLRIIQGVITWTTYK